jgi:hypothetical protein
MDATAVARKVKMIELKWRLIDWPGSGDEPPSYYITEHDTIVAEVYDEEMAYQIVKRLNQSEQDLIDQMRNEL